VTDSLHTIGRKGSTAATTDFVKHRLDGPGGHLWIDGNQKIGGWHPVPNAFSLVEIEDCPHSTAVCRAACYVSGIRVHAPEVHELFQHNSRQIRAVLASPEDDRILWASLLAQYVDAHCGESGFRWHVSGDVFSLEYARWIRAVVERAPASRFWIYTRSFAKAGSLLGLPNLALNLSCDSENYEFARVFAGQFGGRLCYLTVDGSVPADLPPGSVVFPDYSLRERGASPAAARGSSAWYLSLTPSQRAGVCVVDFYGKSERRRCSLPGGGGCSDCTRPNQ
jgi:hypothetical protein